jgi:hypothetical protein
MDLVHQREKPRVKELANVVRHLLKDLLKHRVDQQGLQMGEDWMQRLVGEPQIGDLGGQRRRREE